MRSMRPGQWVLVIAVSAVVSYGVSALRTGSVPVSTVPPEVISITHSCEVVASPMVRKTEGAVVSAASTGNPHAQMIQRALPAIVALVRPVGNALDGAGTAFFVDADGTAVTNGHVVDHDGPLLAVFHDGGRGAVHVTARDTWTDIAILQIDRPGMNEFPFLTFAPAFPGVGQTAVALGSPFGFGVSASVGVVSGIGRKWHLGTEEGHGHLFDMIQTDAAINPGNSGGPLLDAYGRVMGVNTMREPSGQNLGFAIPAVDVYGAVDSVRRFGSIKRGQLGVETEEVDTTNIPGCPVARSSAQQVTSVTPGSAAAKAGVIPGDVLLTFDGAPIPNDDMCTVMIRRRLAGDAMTVEVLRRGAILGFTVTLQDIE